MSHENKNPVMDGIEDAELSGVEQEEFRLLDMQDRQNLVLERDGIATKARDVVRQKYYELTDRLQASDLEADLPPEPDALARGNNTRAVVALLHEKRGTGRVAQVAVMFITSRLHDDGSSRDFSYAPVGEANVSDKDLPTADRFAPIDGFTERDVKTVFDLLAEVNDARFLGELPHIRNDLARIERPDMAIAKMPETTG